MKTAIIGAGMAGLSAARRLREAGLDCAIFEKSRGLGGRMATRQIDDHQFDHGAQYFTARGARFQSRLAQWQSQGIAAEWLPGKWVGTPGMTAPAGSLAEGLQLIRRYRVTGLTGGPGRWQLVSDDAPTHPIGREFFDAVIIAIPAPQVGPLAVSAGLQFRELDRVRYAPCLTLMLAFDRATDFREPWLRSPDETIASLARNDTKPGRNAVLETLVAHATPSWSRTHLEDLAENTADALLRELRPYLGDAAPVYRTVHRWRYARVEQTAGVPFLWDPVQRVGACGDWATGPRVEAAFDSGEAIAAAVLGA